MGNKLSLVGQRFGKLTVISESGSNKHGMSMWVCKCDCGNTTKPISGNSLKQGNTKSCGCLWTEAMTKHGGRNTRLYNIWGGMKARCNKKSHAFYKHYGGRGITVCAEWQSSFETFRDWAYANGYQDGLSIDRIDANGNYCPENCRWATTCQHGNNRRTNVNVEINGVVKTIADWATENGLKYQTVYRRFSRGVRGTDLIKPAMIAMAEAEGQEI